MALPQQQDQGQLTVDDLKFIAFIIGLIVLAFVLGLVIGYQLGEVETRKSIQAAQVRRYPVAAVDEVQGLNLRAAPNLYSTIRTVVQHGERLSILGRRGGWYKARLSSGLEGYVWGAYITPLTHLDWKCWLRTGIITRRFGGLPPGKDVVVLEASMNFAYVLLPTGRKVRVARDAVEVLPRGSKKMMEPAGQPGPAFTRKAVVAGGRGRP